jgi:hypothetical protein
MVTAAFAVLWFWRRDIVGGIRIEEAALELNQQSFPATPRQADHRLLQVINGLSPRQNSMRNTPTRVPFGVYQLEKL